MKVNQSTGKRLFGYALLYKKQIIIALLLLTFAVCSELVGPLLAKRMIDNNILGIEKTWVGVAAGTDGAVDYQGQTYKRSDRVDDLRQPDRRISSPLFRKEEASTLWIRSSLRASGMSLMERHRLKSRTAPS